MGFTFRGNAHQSSGEFEPDELAFVRSELDRCDVVVDVGANLGLYTCLARRGGKRVIAIEPFPDNQRYLYANLIDNGYTDVSVHPVALDAEPGLLTLYGSGTAASLIRGWAGAGAETVVPASTLDTVLRGEEVTDRRLLIKVDVEGAERRVLAGAESTLTMTPAPTWLVEINFSEHHPAGGNPDFESTFEIFWRCGYDAESVDTNRPVTERDVREWVATGGRAFGGHNYIFRRP